jgi:hypothetical protein
MCAHEPSVPQPGRPRQSSIAPGSASRRAWRPASRRSLDGYPSATNMPAPFVVYWP